MITLRYMKRFLSEIFNEMEKFTFLIIGHRNYDFLW